jgi:hypothetical protein
MLADAGEEVGVHSGPRRWRLFRRDVQHALAVRVVSEALSTAAMGQRNGGSGRERGARLAMMLEERTGGRECQMVARSRPIDPRETSSGALSWSRATVSFSKWR